MISEADFQAALERAVNAAIRPTRLQRINSGRVIIRSRSGTRCFRGARAGTADFIGYTIPDGIYLEVEAKSAKWRQGKAQKNNERIVTRHGGIYVIARVDPSLSLDQNVILALSGIDAAIEARRAR